MRCKAGLGICTSSGALIHLSAAMVESAAVAVAVAVAAAVACAAVNRMSKLT